MTITRFGYTGYKSVLPLEAAKRRLVVIKVVKKMGLVVVVNIMKMTGIVVVLNVANDGFSTVAEVNVIRMSGFEAVVNVVKMTGLTIFVMW